MRLPRQAYYAASLVLLAARPALAQATETSALAGPDTQQTLLWFVLSTLVLVMMVF